MTARMPGGGTMFGSWTVEKNISNFCANDDNPERRADGRPLHGRERRCRRCVLRSGRIRHAVPARVQDGRERARCAGASTSARCCRATPAANASSPGCRRRACSRRAGARDRKRSSVNEPGSLYYPRYNQVDFNVKKTFRAGRKTFSGQIDWFNLLNGNAVFSRNSAGRRFTRTDPDDSAGPPDAAGLPDEVVDRRCYGTGCAADCAISSCSSAPSITSFSSRRRVTISSS